MDHLRAALGRLKEAEQTLQPQDVASQASLATAHAVLALINLITSDREDEIDELHKRIADLEFQLEGCRNALRQREDAMAASMKQQQEKT